MLLGQKPLNPVQPIFLHEQLRTKSSFAIWAQYGRYDRTGTNNGSMGGKLGHSTKIVSTKHYINSNNYVTNKLSQVTSLLLIRYFFFRILDKRKAKEIVTPSLSEHTLYMYVYLCRRLQLGLPIKYLSTDFGAL